jgi:hypothetical protein
MPPPGPKSSVMIGKRDELPWFVNDGSRVSSSTSSGTPPVRSTTVVIVSSGRVVVPLPSLPSSSAVRVQWVERDLHKIRAWLPTGTKLGSCRMQQHKRCIRALLDKNFDQLQRGRVSPMQVLYRDYGEHDPVALSIAIRSGRTLSGAAALPRRAVGM